MEEKRRSKRAKAIEDGAWDCSVCTYRNSAEAFKCDMCDVRKGTSTRKPRLNPALVAQQVAQQFAPPPKKEKKDKKEKGSSHKRTNRPPRLKNIDRSSGTSMEVTVGNVTVIITDYKPKKDVKERTSNASEAASNTSVAASDAASDSFDASDSKSDTQSVKSELNGDLDVEVNS